MGISRALACLVAVWPIGIARAEPEHVPRRQPPTLAVTRFPPSSDLDGLQLWLGPTAAAGRIDGGWDSLFGGQLALVRIREHAALGAIGGSAGASRWTERGGGRVWVDGVIGTRVLGRMAGLGAGPVLELSDLAHPRAGGAASLWVFAGVTPYVRAGAVTELGGFLEVGVYLALPVWRVSRTTVDNRAATSYSTTPFPGRSAAW